VNKQPVQNAKDLVTAGKKLNPNEEIFIRVYSQGRSGYVALEPNRILGSGGRASCGFCHAGRSARFSSNVEQDSGLPAAILFLDRETMESDRFNVGALLMTCAVQSFAVDFCFQKICFAFLVNLRFAGSQ